MHTILSTALGRRLAHRIQKALHTDKETLRRPLEKQVPLRQIRQSELRQLEYVSAVALKHAQPFQQTPLQLAANLTKRLNEIEKNPEEKPRKTPSDNTPSDNVGLNETQLHFEFEIAPPGWIFARLAIPDLAVWLQSLIDSPLPWTIPMVIKDTLTTSQASRFLMQTAASARNSTSVFPILHTYARCHSLLRLGQEFGLIQVSSSSGCQQVESDTGAFQLPIHVPIQMPHPLPWLLPNGNFRGGEPAEWQLVEQICATLDDLVEFEPAEPSREILDALPSRQAILKQADRLSQCWQTFYAQCRIADTVRQTNPAQAQVRLGLTCITQKLLHYLLRSIGLPTPLSL